MKELKFRAWDKHKHKMYESFEFIIKNWVIDADEGLVSVTTKDLMGESFLETDNVYTKSNVELMQSTGLKDKKGNDIFEGDIVKGYRVTSVKKDDEKGITDYLMEGPKFTAEVKWDDKKAGFFLKGKNSPSKLDLKQSMGIEIIGNKFKNPELLKNT